MGLGYHVYINDGLGGPVDYATPLTTTASLTYTTSALTYPGDYTFAVRAYDTVNGWEELNTDAKARLVLDAAGADVTNRPSAPSDLSATPTAGGGILVEWAFIPTPGATAPTSFKAWAQVGTLNYALTPGATATYSDNSVAFSASIASLTDGVTYTVGVRATNASGDETNEITTTVVADASGPLPVSGLSGVPTF